MKISQFYTKHFICSVLQYILSELNSISKIKDANNVPDLETAAAR